MSDAMKRVFARETIDAGTFVVPAGEYGEFTVADAERLIASGAVVDPDQMIEVASAEATMSSVAVAEHAHVIAQLAEATEANNAFRMRNDEVLAQVEDLTAAVKAAHDEIATLTTKLDAASKKK